MADIHTEMVEFRSNGSTTPGFLARPEGDGPFPGVIVIQEWWGLNDNIKDIAQRLAHEGYAAFAPDLYHGRVTREPDQAQKMMMQLELQQALSEHNKKFEMKIYPGTHHGFFRDVENGQHDPAASKDSWERMLELFRDNL
ncbi:MAG: dienelactone hydrolase family protein [Chloroflexota bacterium]